MSGVTLIDVPLDKIVVPEARARATLNEDQRALLRASLSAYGVVQPIIVRPLPDGRYELIDGENRLNELKELGQSTARVCVLQVADKDANLLNLLMNVARGSQDPIGEAIAIKKAIEAGASLEEVAKICGHSVSWVKDRLMLLELPDEYQEDLRAGRLTIAHIKEALRLPNAVEVDAALQTAKRLNWPATVLKQYVENRLETLSRHRAENPEAPPPPPPSVEQAAQMVQYGQCLICGRMVDRRTLSLPATCQECYELARYVVHLAGTGNEGMQRVYQAFMAHQSLLQAQQFLVYQQLAQQQLSQTPSPQPSQGGVTPMAGPSVTPMTPTPSVTPMRVTQQQEQSQQSTP